MPLNMFVPIERANEEEHHIRAIEYFTKQVALIDDQKKYSKTMRNATIIMAFATLVYAVVAILQYVYPLK